MKIMTKNGWFTAEMKMIHRLEPWTTPQEIDDDYFPVIPSGMIIVEPPAGFRFRKGVTADDRPTKTDVVPEDFYGDEPEPEEVEPELDADVDPEDAPANPMSALDRLKKAAS